MKKSLKPLVIKVILILLLIFNLLNRATAQGNRLEVSFKEVGEDRFLFYSTIVLGHDSLVEKIFLEVYDETNSTTLYSVEYAKNKFPVLSSNGALLYDRKGNTYSIVSEKTIPFGPYGYKVYIEDLNGLKSEVVFDIK